MSRIFYRSMYRATKEEKPFITIYDSCVVLNKMAGFYFEIGKKYKFEVLKSGNLKITEDSKGCTFNWKSNRFNMANIIKSLGLPLGKFNLMRFGDFFIVYTKCHEKKYQNYAEKFEMTFELGDKIYVDEEWQEF